MEIASQLIHIKYRTYVSCCVVERSNTGRRGAKKSAFSLIVAFSSTKNKATFFSQNTTKSRNFSPFIAGIALHALVLQSCLRKGAMERFAPRMSGLNSINASLIQCRWLLLVSIWFIVRHSLRTCYDNFFFLQITQTILQMSVKSFLCDWKDLWRQYKGLIKNSYFELASRICSWRTQKMRKSVYLMFPRDILTVLNVTFVYLLLFLMF